MSIATLKSSDIKGFADIRRKHFSLGFTLAEILSVILILGIVAVMTIPSAVFNYQQKYFITKYKKTIAALDNAFQQYQITNNWYLNPKNEGNWRGTTGHMQVLGNEFFIPYLGARITNSQWRGGEGANIFNTYNNGKGIKQLNGAPQTLQQWKHGKYTLRDGTEITIMSCHIHWVTSTDESENQNNGAVGAATGYRGVFNAVGLIDVNGEENGPNTVGRDIYPVWFLTTGVFPNPLPEKYTAINIRDMAYFSSIQHSNERCTKDSTGATCPRWFLTHPYFDK